MDVIWHLLLLEYEIIFLYQKWFLHDTQEWSLITHCFCFRVCDIKIKIRVFNYGFNYVSTTFWSWKRHFQLLNVFCNLIWCFQMLTKIVDNVESNPQHIWSPPTHVNFQPTLRWQWRTILINKTFSTFGWSSFAFV